MSQVLKELKIEQTRTTGEEGAAFLRVLAGSNIDTLEKLSLARHNGVLRSSFWSKTYGGGNEGYGKWFGG